MATIKARLPYFRTTDRVPLFCDIIDEDLNIAHQVVAESGTTISVTDLSVGRYLARVHLPSGNITKQYCTLDKTESVQEVDLSLDSDWITVVEPVDWSDNRRPRFASLAPIWLRIWYRAGSNSPWSTVPLLPRRQDSGPYYIRTRPIRRETFEFGGNRSSGSAFTVHFVFSELNLIISDSGQMLLQLGGERLPWRFIAVPLQTEEIACIARPVTAASDNEPREDHIDVVVRSRSLQAEAMLGYLRYGSLDQARRVEQFITSTLKLRGSQVDPAALAVAGYYLVQNNEEQLLDVWGEIYPTFQGSSDFAIVQGWRSLNGRQSPIRRARDWFIIAARNGLPVYTVGLRLLYDGLVELDSLAEGQDREVYEALTLVRPYAAAADWNTQTTTFRGRDPNEPIRTLAGLPDGPRDATLRIRDPEYTRMARSTTRSRVPNDTIFLSSIDLRVLQWMELLRGNEHITPDPQKYALSVALSQDTLNILLPILDLPVIQRIIDSIRHIADKNLRTRCVLNFLVALPNLSEELKKAILDEIINQLAEQGSLGYIRNCISLIAHLQGHQRDTVIAQTINMIRRIKNIRQRAQMIAQLAPALRTLQRDALVGDAYISAFRLRDSRKQLETILVLAPYLPELLAHDAYGHMLKWLAKESDLYIGQRLLQIAPHLPSYYLTQAIALAHRIEPEILRIVVLNSLEPDIGRKKQAQRLHRLHSLIMKTKWKSLLKDTLAEVTSFIPEGVLPNNFWEEQAKDFRQVKDEDARVRCLKQIAPYLEAQVLHETFLQVLEEQNRYLRLNLLGAVWMHLAKDDQMAARREVVTSVNDILACFETRVNASGELELPNYQKKILSDGDRELREMQFADLDQLIKRMLGLNLPTPWDAWIVAATGRHLSWLILEVQDLDIG